MLKESVICITIVIVIIFGNSMTQNYTEKSVEELSGTLSSLRENISQEIVENEKAKREIENIYKNWQEKHDKLAYFIEHDELEKVETELISIKSYVETKEYEDATNELDRCVFILQHIEDKYAFNLQNIF